LSKIARDRSRQTVPLVAHIIYRLDVGGLENGLVNLINHIPEDRYRHAIICLKDFTDFRRRINKKNIDIYALHKKEGKDLLMYARVWRLLRTINPDIVHTRNLASLDCQFFAWLAGVQCRIHGEHGLDINDLELMSNKYRLLRRLLRPLIDRYIPLSRELEEYLCGAIGVQQDRIVSIVNGVDIDRFTPTISGPKSGLRRPLRLSDVMVFGTVGRMEPEKDQITLGKAFVRLAHRVDQVGATVRLVIVGDGSLRAKVQQIFDEAGVSGIVSFAGVREDVGNLLQTMDVFVLPSLAEGISNTILEAMATGLPVVATNVGGNPELVVHGETGYLVPKADPEAMADAMLRYVENRYLIRQHGAAARQRVVEGFSIKRMVERYLDVYDTLIRGARPHVESGIEYSDRKH
jgi:sugar transferase (PEP-CTERM/EpsH1 system associated)